MEKTEMMLLYEQETRKPSTRTVTDGVHIVGIEIWHYEYVKWLEERVARNRRIDIARTSRPLWGKDEY